MLGHIFVDTFALQAKFIPLNSVQSCRESLVMSTLTYVFAVNIHFLSYSCLRSFVSTKN